MQHKLFVCTVSAGLILAGCSMFKATTFDCSNLLTAAEDGTRVSLRTLESGERAEARFNGVSATCKASGDTDVSVSIDAGLIVKRERGEPFVASLAELPIILALLDEEDNLIGNESFSYRIAFDPKVDKLYPVAEMTVVIPIGGRIVMTLTPTVVR